MLNFNFLQKRIQEIKDIDKQWQSSGIDQSEDLPGLNANFQDVDSINTSSTKSMYAHNSIHLAHRLKGLAFEMAKLDDELTQLEQMINVNKNQDED